ncbi:MAG TPA: multicopper oxidase family protein [Bryobacteraceae bacterium]|nr:multicopper oxidase family protein [Bryobacteraceae bacterium]
MTLHPRVSRFASVALLSLVVLAARAQTVGDPPPAHSPIRLSAVTDPESGRAAFSFEGKQEPPVIRAMPGDPIRITYRNAMSSTTTAKCATGPCMNMTNLHFHGLHVSPNSPQDDVLSMLAMPGESLEYEVAIPRTQPPGLYWYHTHPHGESYRQVLDGMSGAIVIEGIERYVPEVLRMRERILVLRDRVLEEGDPDAKHLKDLAEIPPRSCGSSTEQPERVFTVNGTVRPEIPIAAGERQFWRIVNASPDLYADLQIDGEPLEVVALDGMPLAYHDPRHTAGLASHVLLPPAGRLEAIVTGPRAPATAKLRTRCFDTGPDGDPNPPMVLADLVDVKTKVSASRTFPVSVQKPGFVALPTRTLAVLEKRAPEFTVTFTEDKHGFYINGKQYSPADAPMARVRTGGYHHWRVVNKTREVHPFHIHQVHFLVYATNDQPAAEPGWLDTVNVPVEGSVDLIMDFTDPIIRGLSLFHCHLLSHEDKGMMAKILFE